MPLTTAEIIEMGEYLEPNFNPMALTMPQIQGILINHKISYPPHHNKAKLVQIFNEEFKPRAAEFRRERDAALKKSPSGKGIVDGVTGHAVNSHLNPDVRRSTRRSSRTPEVTSLLQGSTRRSSAGPSSSTATRGTLKNSAAAQPALAEESEEEVVPKAATRKTKTTTGRKSEGENDSAWDTDNNIFQSEPDTPPPERVRAKSKRVKKAESPPVTSPLDTHTSRTTRRQDPREKPTTRFSSSPSRKPAHIPSFPSITQYDPPQHKIKTVADWEHVEAPKEVLEYDEEDAQEDVQEQPEQPVPEHEEFLVPLNDTEEYVQEFVQEPHTPERSPSLGEESDDHNARVSNRIAKVGAKRSSLSRRPGKQLPSSSPSMITAIGRTTRWLVTLLTLMSAITTLVWYKIDSAYIGYCDAGSNTNLRMPQLQANRSIRQQAAHKCRAEFNITSPSFCEPFPLVSPFEANTCTPCPKRAVCTPDSVTCQSSFIMKPHFASKIPFASAIFNGMPGFGSVAFPPECVEDLERARRIGGLVRGVEDHLATERARRICAGVKALPPGQGGEGKAFGYEQDALKASVLKVVKDVPNPEDLYDRALVELAKLALISSDEDENGDVYYTASRSNFNLMCKIQIGLKETWDAWKGRIFALVLCILGFIMTRRKLANDALEARKVAELVQEALESLQEQEMAYHVDPVLTPEPYIAPAHLRDLILRHEHSPAVRQKLWVKVQKIVEGNSNVRANLEEVKGEDTRVWRWVGSSGTPRSKRRVSFAATTESGTLIGE
ncbi:inner nuclear membrane protein enriched at telomere/subtelomere region [Tulasnella sp. 419]|nr:inner nuclear membrane protein enriched at telomere/subtelomere region [Tulasnella sp. 419]